MTTETVGQTKVCRICKEERPEDFYYKGESRCKACKKALDQARDALEETKQKRRARRAAKLAAMTQEERDILRQKNSESALRRYHRIKEFKMEMPREGTNLRPEDKPKRGRPKGEPVVTGGQVFTPLPLPQERATSKGELRKAPAPPPVVPKFRRNPTYGLAEFWAEFPESHREWFAVLKEDGIPASSPLYAHPCHERYAPRAATSPPNKVTPAKV